MISPDRPSNRPRGAVKRAQLRAYTAGMQAAVGKALPELERRYRLRTARNAWVIAYAIFAVSFAAGYALGKGGWLPW